MAEASQAQVKLFFALAKEAGFEAEAIKERAKKKFSLESFTEISSTQISELIESLQATAGVEPKPKEKHTHNFEVEAKSEKHIFYSCSCGTITIQPR
jgi:hypothetical protein